MHKTWFITGCSTGFGRSLAKYLLEKGEEVAVTARNTSALDEFADYDNALVLALDVIDPAMVSAATEKALERFGKIDVLVNNAGYGFRGAVEEGGDQEIERIFATNFFGPVNLIKAVLPGMRARRSGDIVNFSSIAAFKTAEGSGYYGATKAALEALSDALRKEVFPLGIRVMVVEPGPFKTDFAGRSLAISETNIADYAQTAGKRKERDDPHTEWKLGDTDKAAKVIADVMAKDAIPFRLLLGSDAVQIARADIAAKEAEIGQWEAMSTATDA